MCPASTKEVKRAMLMNHCNVNIDPFEIWYLKDIEQFTNRMLLIGKCDKCNKKIISLVETRISDNRVFKNTLSGTKAEKIAAIEKRRISYTLSSLKHSKSGWIYGVNVGIKNKKGEITQVRQYAADFNGKKKLVKQIQI